MLTDDSIKMNKNRPSLPRSGVLDDGHLTNENRRNKSKDEKCAIVSLIDNYSQFMIYYVFDGIQFSRVSFSCPLSADFYIHMKYYNSSFVDGLCFSFDYTNGFYRIVDVLIQFNGF